MAFPVLPADWRDALAGDLEGEWFRELETFVEGERAKNAIYPAENETFSALARTPLAQVKVVLLGQDPYHGEGQAHGLAFSVRPGVAPPPSLANLMKELASDVGCAKPDHGCLEAWADRGVLLLNTALTVRKGEAGSHAKSGWARFSDAVIRTVDARTTPAVFLLLGAPAKKKAKLIDARRHRVIEGVHPSPLSASQGFFGSKPFSRVNAALEELGQTPVDWRLANLGVPIERKVRTREGSAS
jgi:uracil-DNA glycosylase